MSRDFKGVWIPKEIWLNKDLSMLEKVIYTEISSLDNEDHCIAGNDYFAEFCNCSQSAVSKAIKHLKELNLIEELEFNGRNRKLRVVKFTEQGSKIYEADQQILLSNNINSNTENKKIISKDIITKTGSDFEFGNKKKKSKSIYAKCVDLINAFTDDIGLRKSLTTFLNLQLEIHKDNGTPYYTNMFKGCLNRLLEFDINDRRAIVDNTIRNGWKNFYPLKNYDTEKKRLYEPDNADVVTTTDKDFYKNLEKEGKQVIF